MRYMLHIQANKILISLPLKKENKSQRKVPTLGKMEVSGKRGQEHGPKAEKDPTERATELGRRRREEI